MDFLKIVMDGFLSKSKYKILDKYYLRTYREANDVYYSSEEFFDELLAVIENMMNVVSESRMKLISDCHKGIMCIQEDDTKSEEAKKKEIGDFKSQIDTFKSINNVSLHVDTFIRKYGIKYVGLYSGHLYESHLNFALEHLKLAKYTIQLEEGESKLVELNKKQKDLESEQSKINDNAKIEDGAEKSYENVSHLNWFRLAICFAKGDIPIFIQDSKDSAPYYIKKFLIEDGDLKGKSLESAINGYKSYLNQTWGENEVSMNNKNIFSNSKKDKNIRLVLDYCEDNRVEICADFKRFLEEISTD